MLRICCFCIALKKGCFIIAALYIFSQIGTILNSKTVLDYLEEEENEDEENKRQREAVRTRAYFIIGLAVLKIVVGLVITYATIEEAPTLLKGCAGFLFAGVFIPFVIAVMDDSGRSSQSFIVEAFYLAISVYGACVLWSYADEIENPELPLTVFVLPQPFPAN